MLVLAFAAVVLASPGLEHFYTDEQMLGDGTSNVVVATVVATADGTNGSPPTITLRIEDVLSGQISRGTTAQPWRPRPNDIDYVGGDSEQRWKEWNANPIEGPAVNSRWILLLERGVSPRCRYPYSDERRAWVSRTIGANRRQAEERVARQRAIAKEKAAIEEARIAAADLDALWKRSTEIIIGRCGSTMSDADGSRVTVEVETWLRKRGSKPNRPLVFPAGYYVPELCENRVRAVLFLRRAAYRLSNGYRGNGWRLTDPTTGILPARPEILERVRARRVPPAQ